MAEQDRITGRGEWEGDGRASSFAEPQSTDEARREIERTRGRISATLDAIEGRLDEKKERLRQRADVLRPVRRQVRLHLWPSLGIAFGAGLALSMLGGGEDQSERGHLLDEEDRRERRQWRAERRARLRAEREHSLLQQRLESAERPERSEKSPLESLGNTIARAIADGLKERASRGR